MGQREPVGQFGRETVGQFGRGQGDSWTACAGRW